MYYPRLSLKNFSPFNILYHTIFLYPVPVNINYFWNFGVLALLTLIFQIITGIFLGMHYISSAATAFSSIEHIMRDVNYGWLFRYLHANGASIFFLVVFCHVFRGIYFGSYSWPRTYLWNIGVVILLIMIFTAFLGYVLPWGQMSFWAATVITNLASAIPLIGSDILSWLWGGFSVSSTTLTRFYSLHFLLPFVIFMLSFLHILFLHTHGSSNPLGVHGKEFVSFAPFFLIKDLFSFLFYSLLFSFLVFFSPNFVNHPDNYILANPLSTPNHIVPEWYLLPFYAILRSIPNKILGVIALVFSILILMLLPGFIRMHLPGRFSPISRLIFWFFFIISILLSFIGGMPAEEPYIEIGQFSTFFYFFLFFFFFSNIDRFELIMNLKRIQFKIIYLSLLSSALFYFFFNILRVAKRIWTVYYMLPFYRISGFRKQRRWWRLQVGTFTQNLFLLSNVRLFSYLLEIQRVDDIISDKYILTMNYFKHNCYKNISERGFSKNSRGFRDAKYREQFSLAALKKRALIRRDRRVRKRF
jgi:ubiquinol-cytochrome c reductase cytochrome b/c1 subunit